MKIAVIWSESMRHLSFDRCRIIERGVDAENKMFAFLQWIQKKSRLENGIYFVFSVDFCMEHIFIFVLLCIWWFFFRHVHADIRQLGLFRVLRIYQLRIRKNGFFGRIRGVLFGDKIWASRGDRSQNLGHDFFGDAVSDNQFADLYYCRHCMQCRSCRNISCACTYCDKLLCCSAYRNLARRGSCDICQKRRGIYRIACYYFLFEPCGKWLLRGFILFHWYIRKQMVKSFSFYDAVVIFLYT